MVYVPAIEVEIEAPTAVNTTKLPIYLNYTIVIRNRGNGTGVVLRGDETYVIAPGQEVRIAANKTAEWAGEHSVEAVVNGTRYAKAVRVYYHTPRLQAEPVYINATKLPANPRDGEGQQPGQLNGVGGVAVAPGETGEINTTITVEAAGSYVVEIGGVEVPVTVRYYVAAFDWRVGGPSEVEALPGETYAAWLWIKKYRERYSHPIHRRQSLRAGSRRGAQHHQDDHGRRRGHVQRGVQSRGEPQRHSSPRHAGEGGGARGSDCAVEPRGQAEPAASQRGRLHVALSGEQDGGFDVGLHNHYKRHQEGRGACRRGPGRR